MTTHRPRGSRPARAGAWASTSRRRLGGRDRALHLSESHGGVAVGGRERDDAPVVREPPERRLDDCDRVVQLREDVPEHDQIELVGVVVTAFCPAVDPKEGLRRLLVDRRPEVPPRLVEHPVEHVGGCARLDGVVVDDGVIGEVVVESERGTADTRTHRRGRGGSGRAARSR